MKVAVAMEEAGQVAATEAATEGVATAEEKEVVTVAATVVAVRVEVATVAAVTVVAMVVVAMVAATVAAATAAVTVEEDSVVVMVAVG